VVQHGFEFVKIKNAVAVLVELFEDDVGEVADTVIHGGWWGRGGRSSVGVEVSDGP
jgi:hypothetical protein